MTREKAIEMLKYNSNVIHKTINNETDPNEVKALDMAIDALSQQTDDAIRRQSAFREFEKDQYRLEYCKEHGIDRSISMEMVRIRLHDLPPVTPKQRWIPVSERSPEDHENVLIYLSSNQITIGLYNSHRLPFVDKPIGWGADAPHGWSSDEVVAWMPLPESYMESEEQECG